MLITKLPLDGVISANQPLPLDGVFSTNQPDVLAYTPRKLAEKTPSSGVL